MKKRGLASEYLIWILIAVTILAIVVISIVVLKEKGFGVIEGIKRLFGGS